jgi:hypothetical protein
MSALPLISLPNTSGMHQASPMQILGDPVDLAKKRSKQEPVTFGFIPAASRGKIRVAPDARTIVFPSSGSPEKTDAGIFTKEEVTGKPQVRKFIPLNPVRNTSSPVGAGISSPTAEKADSSVVDRSRLILRPVLQRSKSVDADLETLDDNPDHFPLAQQSAAQTPLQTAKSRSQSPPMPIKSSSRPVAISPGSRVAQGIPAGRIPTDKFSLATLAPLYFETRQERVEKDKGLVAAEGERILFEPEVLDNGFVAADAERTLFQADDTEGFVAAKAARIVTPLTTRFAALELEDARLD